MHIALHAVPKPRALSNAKVTSALKLSYSSCVTGRRRMFEHVFAVGNLDKPSCKNSMVTCNIRCGNTFQPVVKNKMSLKVMSESSASSMS